MGSPPETWTILRTRIPEAKGADPAHPYQVAVNPCTKETAVTGRPKGTPAITKAHLEKAL